MATSKKTKAHSLSLRLAAESVASDLGVIRGCTVAKADVQALGKIVYLDRTGAITRDEKLAVKELPVYTDGKFLDTLMSAAAKAGPRVKTREDHDDSIGARAGYSDLFRRVNDSAGDRVVADIHIFASYRNRGIVMETAAENPEEIGLSIDFLPEFEVQGDRALMRCAKLLAVDIVDQGAITPGGLFLSAGVDSEDKKETTSRETPPEPPPPMPDPVEKKSGPTNEEIMSALGALSKTVGECVAMMNAAKAGAAPAADAEMKASVEKLSLAITAQETQIKTLVTQNAQMKKERALMGFRGTPVEREKLANASPEDIEKAAAGVKSYDQLVNERVASEKCSRSSAHDFVRMNHREAYRESLKARGIYDAAKDKTLVTAA